MIPQIGLVALLIVAIPIAAFIDYFAFRKRFKELYGQQVPWTFFLVPCTLEIGCFIAGYVLGGAGI